ncbi:MAG TPA: secretin N-terminal domain-containing protein [Verrucomicrobiae bacterium]|nr:secretin N-terminal domain-containing protein [Verrucomicrobiae bacterium]
MNLSPHLKLIYVVTLFAATALSFAQAPQTNAPATNATTNSPAASTNAAPSTNAVAQTNRPPGAGGAQASDDQLSFQGANIDMVVQWLAKATGKSVVKHPRVQCQLTIVSSKGLSQRESVNLVYRALALEGFTAIESSKSILIVPEGSEPKSTPEFLEGADIPEGRQRLMRIFNLEHVAPAELRDKLKTALSEKAIVEINERGNQLIITDYTDNIRLVSGLIRELDVVSTSDTTVEFLPLKHGDAEDVASLLGQILNAQVNVQPAAPSSSSSSSSRSSSSRMSPNFGPSMMMESSPTPSPTPSGPTSTGNPSSSIKIWPDRTSNQLIVVAPKAKLDEIKKLLEILDTDKPQDVRIRVLPLKNVSAEDLVREMAPLLQKMTGKSARERVDVSANSRSNSLIILSSEENFQALQRLVEGLDREDAQERTTRSFELRNADAEDVAKQLQDLQQDQNSNSRYPFFIYGDFGGRRDTKKINVVADRRRNTVIVQAPPAAMDDLEKLIKTLDAPVSDAALAPKIYKMKYVSAADIADVLNELFLKKQSQQRTYWDPYGFPSSDRGDDARAGNKLFGKVRITHEPYSNSIIITANSVENLSAIESVLNELDSPSQAGETTMRITLNFARAVPLASDLNVLFAKGGSPALRPVQQQQQPQQPNNGLNQQNNQQSQNSFGLEQEAKEDAYFPWLGGNQENSFGRPGETTAQRPISDLIGRVRVVPDRRSNSILLTSNLHFFPQLLKLINELDAPTPQVLVEARIVEVASDFRDKIGTRWSPDGSTFKGEDLENSGLFRTSTAFRDVFTGTVGPTALRSGIFDSTLNLDVLIQFLRKNANAKVLAEPQLNISDNELGKLFVGAQFPVQTGTLRTDVGGVSSAFIYRDVGIILEVTPRINSSNEVVLRIRAESSSIRAGETIENQPIFDTRNFRTELMVKDRETIVLGGIIQRERTEVLRKTPGLGNIPGLGWAFKKKDQTSREVELMVFLRPKITRSPEEAHQLYLDTKNKVPLIQKWDSENPPPKVQEHIDKQKEPNGGG